MIDFDEAAALLKCEPAKLEALLRSGELPGAKFGRSWVIPREAFMQRLNELALQQAAERRAPKSSVQCVAGRRNARPDLSA